MSLWVNDKCRRKPAVPAKQTILLPLEVTFPRLKPITDASSRPICSGGIRIEQLNSPQQTKSSVSPARVSRRPAAADANIELPYYLSTTYTHLRQLSDRDLHSPRIELFRQTQCHLLHLRVPHEHTPSTWLIQDRATTAPILLPSKDMATSSSEYPSNSAYIQQTGRTDTSKAPIRLPAASAAATRLWIPTTTAAASMGSTAAAAAALPAAIPPAASHQLRTGNDTVPIAAGADVQPGWFEWSAREVYPSAH